MILSGMVRYRAFIETVFSKVLIGSSLGFPVIEGSLGSSVKKCSLES